MKRRTSETAACWGVFREVEHSPGRRTDDAGILKATGRRLEGAGFTVDYLDPASLAGRSNGRPTLAFAMCEGLPALDELNEWEKRGVCVVNRPHAVANTHRERMIPLLENGRIPTPESLVLDCDGPVPRGKSKDRLYASCWIKQATEHKTREGDVVFAADPSAVEDALGRLLDRGLPRAVAQRHVEGDLVKFYGVTDASGANGGSSAREPSWFRWFYPKHRPVAGHVFDEGLLARIASRTAHALDLDVWGGDAIVAPDGEMFVIDVNAWPSFALFREEAADRIAAHLTTRLHRLARVAV